MFFTRVRHCLEATFHRVGHPPRRGLLLLWYIAANIGNNLKKTKASLPKLSAMTTGLVYAIDSAIKERFANILDSKDAIIAAETFPKFKLK